MLAATRNFVYNTFFILSLLFVFILLPFGVSFSFYCLLEYLYFFYCIFADKLDK